MITNSLTKIKVKLRSQANVNSICNETSEPEIFISEQNIEVNKKNEKQKIKKCEFDTKNIKSKNCEYDTKNIGLENCKYDIKNCQYDTKNCQYDTKNIELKNTELKNCEYNTKNMGIKNCEYDTKNIEINEHKKKELFGPKIQPKIQTCKPKMDLNRNEQFKSTSQINKQNNILPIRIKKKINYQKNNVSESNIVNQYSNVSQSNIVNQHSNVSQSNIVNKHSNVSESNIVNQHSNVIINLAVKKPQKIIYDQNKRLMSNQIIPENNKIIRRHKIVNESENNSETKIIKENNLENIPITIIRKVTSSIEPLEETNKFPDIKKIDNIQTNQVIHRIKNAQPNLEFNNLENGNISQTNTIIRKNSFISNTSGPTKKKKMNDISTKLNNDKPTKKNNNLIKKKKIVESFVIKSVIKREKDDIVPTVKFIKDEYNGTIDELNNLPEIEGCEIMTECLQILKSGDSKSDLAKEELIEKVEYQKDLLIKNQNKYKENDYSLKMTAIDKILSKLRLGLADDNLKEMNITNKKIDRIILDKKVPEDQFKKKVDLSGPRDNDDPSYHLLTNSRKYFEKMAYVKPPPEIANKDPKNKNFGNQPMPPELLRMINFR